MILLTLANATQQVDIPVYQKGRGTSCVLLQSDITTGGWVRYGSKKRGVVRGIALDLDLLTLAKSNEIEAFFAGVNGITDSFSLTDNQTVSVEPVFFGSPVIDAELYAYDCCRLRLPLRVNPNNNALIDELNRKLTDESGDTLSWQ